MGLESERCEACTPDAPKVTDTEGAQLLNDIPGWSVIEVDGVKRLRRVFKFKGWEPAMAFANEVGKLAEEADHHPAILVEWGRVTVEWWTHAIGGLHRNDFIMASKVNSLGNAK